MAKNTIKITNYGNVFMEMPATAVAIKPGMILEYVSSTGLKVQAHATAGSNVLPIVALEDELQGKTITESYAATAGTPIQCWIPQRGDIAYLRPLSTNAIAIGDPVESAGAGKIQKYVLDVDSSKNATGEYIDQIIGYALEAHSAVASDGAETVPFIQVRIR